MHPDWIIPSLTSSTKEAVLHEISNHLHNCVPSIDTNDLFARLVEREKKASTGADQGLAIPHATVTSTDKLIVTVARSKSGIDFGALDNMPSSLFFAIVNPVNKQAGEVSYLQAISAICRLMRSASIREKLIAAERAEDIFKILLDEESSKLGA
jgi:mannitol/fructose-specific phosphotransferase system IIA component (Ntr-type)